MGNKGKLKELQCTVALIVQVYGTVMGGLKTFPLPVTG